MFQFKDEINEQVFCRVPKQFIRDGRWALLPKASKAIYLPIACHANAKGVSYPGTETIAALAGIDTDTVTAGIKGLSTVNGLFDRIEKYVTPRGLRAYRYYLHIPPMEKGSAFPVYRSVLDGGNWAMLNRTGQALYMAMRAFSFYDTNFDSEGYAQRIFELCMAEKDVLCECAGINERSFQEAFRSLVDCWLVDRTPDGGCVVFIRPEYGFSADFLNKRLLKGKNSE